MIMVMVCLVGGEGARGGIRGRLGKRLFCSVCSRWASIFALIS